MADLDLSALNSALGAYYRQNKKAVMQKLYSAEDARKQFQVVTGVQDEYVMTEIEVTEMMQPYQAAWTPKGSVDFYPNVIKNRGIKVDFPFTPKKMEATWLGYLKTNGSSPEEYPFVAYIYDRILEKLARDINKTVWQGVYAAPTPGTAGSAVSSFDGMIEVVKDARTAGTAATVATGAITAANVVDKAELMFDSVSEEFRNNSTVLVMSHTHLMYYLRKRRDPAFSNYSEDTIKGKDVFLDFADCRILAPKYYNSNLWFLTLPENMIMVEDGVNEEEKIIVQANRRELEVIIDCKRAVGLGISRGYTWASDQG